MNAGNWQRWALRTLAAGLVLLALLPWSTSDDSAASEASESVANESTTSQSDSTVAPANASTDSATDAGVDTAEPESAEENSSAAVPPLSAVDQAVQLASERFDIARHLPGWTIEAAENVATGATEAGTKSVFINPTSAPSVDGLSIVVLHSLGHAIDETYMTPEKRDEFRLFRNHNPASDWIETDNLATTTDSMNSAEDFAEVFVAWALDGEYTTRSQSVADEPTAPDLVLFCELIALDDVDCNT